MQPQIHVGTAGVARAISTLRDQVMGYEFEIQYLPCMENKAAEALSRVPSQIELAAITFPMVVDVRLILEQTEVDPKLAKIKEELQNNPDSHPHYSLDQDWLLYKRCLVLSSSSTLIPTLLHEFHCSLVGAFKFSSDLQAAN